MALEDKHEDILKKIETNIVRIDREYGSLRDVDAIKALEALTSYWQRIALGKEPPSRELPEASEKIFEAVRNSLELNKNRKEKDSDAPKTPRRFSRVLQESTQDEIYLACLRKVEKSAKRWKKHYGERGYLDFVSNYV